jgi:ribosomal subunit interface protein
MHIRISGHHMNNGASFSNFVENKIANLANKYFKRAIGADVVFLKENNKFISSLMINNGTSNHSFIRGNGSSHDVYESFNMALNKLEKQLRRTHSKLCSHKNKFLAKVKRDI